MYRCLIYSLSVIPLSPNGDCGHEIKRGLLLARKVTTNLDTILKIRDITLRTKVPLVKAMVFPVDKFSSVQFSGSVVSDSLRPRESQHARPLYRSIRNGLQFYKEKRYKHKKATVYVIDSF